MNIFAILADFYQSVINNLIHQLRKVAKSKTVFPSDDSLFKMLYLATMDITKKWTGRRKEWVQIHSQLRDRFKVCVNFLVDVE